jgi:tetratricopeptide (TPR) repeat protein
MDAIVRWDSIPISAGPDGGGQVDADRTTPPSGDVYDWYQRGLKLLDARNPAAAAALLEHAAAAEPDSPSIREALARAQFNAGLYGAARDSFAATVADSPDDDYAHFGLGLAASRLGEYDTATEHLALAVAMRPDNKHYATALRAARAARARS